MELQLDKEGVLRFGVDWYRAENNIPADRIFSRLLISIIRDELPLAPLYPSTPYPDNGQLAAHTR